MSMFDFLKVFIQFLVQDYPFISTSSRIIIRFHANYYSISHTNLILQNKTCFKRICCKWKGILYRLQLYSKQTSEKILASLSVNTLCRRYWKANKKFRARYIFKNREDKQKLIKRALKGENISDLFRDWAGVLKFSFLFEWRINSIERAKLNVRCAMKNFIWRGVRRCVCSQELKYQMTTNEILHTRPINLIKSVLSPFPSNSPSHSFK